MEVRFGALKASLFGQAINGVISFFGIVIWANFSNQKILANVFIPLAVMSIAVDLIDFGGNSWITRESVYANLKTRDTLAFLFPKLKVIIFISTSISLGNFILTRNIPLSVFLFIYPIFILSISYFQGLCLRTDKYFDFFFVQFLERVCWFLPIIFIKLINNVLTGILISLIFGSAISLTYIIIKVLSILKVEDKISQTQYNLKDTYRLSFNLGLSSVVSDFYSLDTYLVNQFSNLTEAGGFSLVQKNRNFAVLGFSLFGAKLRLAVSHSRKSSRKLFQSDWEILALNFIALIAVLINASRIIDFLYGSEYLILTSVMQIGILVFMCSGVCIVLQSYISGMRDDAFLTIFTGISVIAALLSISFGASISGALGASLGLLISFFIQVIILIMRAVILNYNKISR